MNRLAKTLVSTASATSVTAGLLVSVPTLQPAAAAPIEKQVTIVLAQRSQGGQAAHSSLDNAIRNYIDGRGNSYFQAISNGRISLKAVTVQRYITQQFPCLNQKDTPNTDLLRQEAEQKIGFQPGPNKLLLVYTPNGTEKCRLDASGSAKQPGDTAWINDAEQFISDGNPLPATETALRSSAILHEMAHNLGIGHNGSTRCTGHPDLVESEQGSRCRRSEYGGIGGADDSPTTKGSYPSAGEIHQVGWLSDDEYRIVTGGSQTINLNPLSGNTGTRGIRLPSTTGGSYWVDYRADSTWDAGRLGVHITKRYVDGNDHSVVTLAATNDWTDGARNLASGKSLTLDGGRYTLKTNSETASSASITVTVNGRLAPTPIKSTSVTAIPGGLDVSWQHVAQPANVDRYEIWAMPAAQNWVKLAEVPSGSSSTRILGLDSVSHVRIGVRAYNSAGSNLPLEFGDVTPISMSTVGVNSLGSSPVTANGKATLSWTYPQLSNEYGTVKATIRDQLTGDEWITSTGATSYTLTGIPLHGGQYTVTPTWTTSSKVSMRGKISYPITIPPHDGGGGDDPQPKPTTSTYRYTHTITLKKRISVYRKGKKSKRWVKRTYRYTYTATKRGSWSATQKAAEQRRTKRAAQTRAKKQFNTYIKRKY